MGPLHHVTDPLDERLSDYVALTDVALRRRREPADGLFIAESALVLERAVATGHQLRSVLLADNRLHQVASLLVDSDAPVYLADAALLEQVTGFDVHRGVLASVHRRPPAPLPEVLATSRRLVVVEDLVSHTNLGAVFRSVAALGADGVVLSPSCVDPLYRRAVRVSMAAVLAVPYARAQEWPAALEDVRSAGFTRLGLTPDPAATALDALPGELRSGRWALLLGSEGPGLSDAALAHCDLRVRIPMTAGVDSLNAAAATAVAMWELVRSDRSGGSAA